MYLFYFAKVWQKTESLTLGENKLRLTNTKIEQEDITH